MREDWKGLVGKHSQVCAARLAVDITLTTLFIWSCEECGGHWITVVYTATVTWGLKVGIGIWLVWIWCFLEFGKH
jgi:hypothetical protein